MLAGGEEEIVFFRRFVCDVFSILFWIQMFYQVSEVKTAWNDKIESLELTLNTEYLLVNKVGGGFRDILFN